MATKKSLEERLESPSPFQIKVNFGNEGLREYNFDQDKVTIGRDESCDVSLDNLGVSRNHAQIERLGDCFLLSDLESTTGTFIRGNKIEEHYLNDKDDIFLAKHTLTFTRLSSTRWYEISSKQGKESEKTSARSGTGRQQHSAQLMQTMAVDFSGLAKKKGGAPTVAPAFLLLTGVVGGANKRIPWFKNTFFFGSAADCDFGLSGWQIQSRHVALVHEEQGFFVYQLGRGKPAKVNGQFVDKAKLNEGDLIQVGEFNLVFSIAP